MLYIDKKYAGMLSPRLERFKWTGKDTAQFRCPICGDSKKDKKKCRGGFYSLKDTLMFGCFNCGGIKGANVPFGVFLKFFDAQMYKEYTFEKFKYDNDHRWFHKRIEKQEEKAKQTFPLLPVCMVMGLHQLTSIENLPVEHIAKQYIINRQIPFQFWKDLYYTENFKQWVKDKIDPKKFEVVTKTDPRIVIPFFNKDGIPFAYQGRYIGDRPGELRYISINPDSSNILLFGVERLETGKPIYVVEGPFDSMFLPNAIAVAGSGLQKILKYKKLSPVFIFDNEPRNPQVVANMQKVIDAGKDIVIWPTNLKEKDINQMVLAGKNVLDIIGKNTYNKTIAKLKITQWSKL